MQKPLFVTRLEKRARRKRFQLFTHLLGKLHPPIRILDVGGTFGFWKILDYTKLGEIHITFVNLFHQDNLPANFHSQVGDARDLKAHSAHDFDVVLSNSAIGHVGSFEDQKRMAGEIRRIGRRYFVQTPNHHFPIDWQTLIPFFHFLPLQFRARLLQFLPITSFGRFKTYSQALQWTAGVRNLTYCELRALFPEATIVRERFWGFTKSFMVFHGFDTANGEASSMESTFNNGSEFENMKNGQGLGNFK